MTNTCPNCSHPLRPGAQYCGYCGAEVSTSLKGSNTDAAVLEGASGIAKSPARLSARRRDRGKMVSIIAIILLVLIILSALAFQYWTMIYPYLNLYFPSLFPK